MNVDITKPAIVIALARGKMDNGTEWTKATLLESESIVEDGIMGVKPTNEVVDTYKDRVPFSAQCCMTVSGGKKASLSLVDFKEVKQLTESDKQKIRAVIAHVSGVRDTSALSTIKPKIAQK